MTSRKTRIIRAFSDASGGYEEAAAVQAEVARRLAERIAARPLPAAPRVVEIGCGTGFLTRALRERVAGASWLVTDAAPPMLERCAALSADPRMVFRVMDGEAPDLPPSSADLVASSLAMQWFADPAEALRALAPAVAPGGLVAFATLGAGTFAEWRAAHARAGLPCGTPNYATAEQAAAWAPAGFSSEIVAESLTVPYDSAQLFLASLKAIGAATPAPGHRPLTPGALRRVLRELPGGVTMTYRILYGFLVKGAAA